MNPTFGSELASKLEGTLSSVLEERRRAENFLKTVERQPGYSVCLLSILQNESMSPAVRLSASITFKNFVKNNWKVEVDGDNLIPEADRDQLKAQLINAMLTSSGSIQHQLSEAIGFIGREDFPTRWPGLLPDIIQRMAQLGADMGTVQGLLYTTHSLFKRYRYEMRSDELFSEMKLVIGQFGEPLTTLAANLMNLVVGPGRINDGSRLVNVFQALFLICKIFLSLNCQDLPEFFEDNMEQWMQIFRELLRLDAQTTNLVNLAAEAAGLSEGETGACLVEQVKSQVCDNIGLYATKYAADFTNYLPEFVKDVWEMLITVKVHVKYDMLIGNGLEFLASVVSRPQHKQLFEAPETLQRLCELIILPNIQLSPGDEELFEDNPEEYIRRDLEGSDAHTRRKSACNLVCALCEAFEGPVITNFATYIDHLLKQYAAAISTNGNAAPSSSGWGAKDSALLLVTSLASRGKTEKFGVTSSSQLVDIPTFFETHILPELQNPAVDQLPVIKADCLRYAITFRGLLSSAAISILVNLLPNFLIASSPVVHNYAASLLEKLLLMTLPNQPVLTALVSKTDIADPQLMIRRLLEALSRHCSLESVYMMRALLRTCACLEDRCLPSMNDLVVSLVGRLGQVVKNPSKPQFNHFLFESLSLCIRLTCAADSNSIVHFEAALFPVFQEILQQDITEFFPYVFQLLAVMLEQYPLSESVRSVVASKMKNGAAPTVSGDLRPPAPYMALLPRLLVPSLWEATGTVGALARLMQAYLLHNVEAVLNANKVEAMLGVYQRMVASRSNDIHAFTVISALLLAVPRNLIQPFLPQIFICIFQRLQTAKTEKFLRCLTQFLANFALSFSASDLIAVMDGVQNKIFSRILEKVLIPFAESAISSPVGLNNPSLILTAHSNAGDSGSANTLSSVSMSALARSEWRTVAIGLTSICSETEQVSPSPASVYNVFWAPLMNSILSGLAAGPGKGGALAAEAAVAAATSQRTSPFGDERFTDIAGDSTSYSLIFASYRLPDLCPSFTDPRAHLATSLSALSNRIPGKVTNALTGGLSEEARGYLQSILAQSMVQLN